MTSLVFFGAGASKPFGIPTMQEMVNQFEEKLEKYEKDCFEFYSKVKTTIKERMKIDVDIESIFSVLDGITSKNKPEDLGHYAVYYINSICESSDEKYPLEEHVDIATKTSKKLKEYLKDACSKKLSNSEYKKIYEKSYIPFFSKIQGTSQVFPNEHELVVDWKAYTTNYDNIFEDFWDSFESPNTHFEKEEVSNTHVFSALNLDTHSFCKLHGSLDWTREVETERIVKENTSGYPIYDTKGDVMLFPIQQKDLYLHPWFSLFSELHMGLQTRDILYVVGYAFNDEFIKNTFQEILSTNSNKQMILINPDAQDIRHKFSSHVRNQIELLPIKFGDKHFDLQFSDHVDSIKTVIIRILTSSKTIHVHCNKEHASYSILNAEKIKVRSTTTGNDPQFTFDLRETTDHEIKIELKIPYKFGDEVLLSLSDHTEKLNFGVDYSDLIIANSHEITEYVKKDTIPWMKHPIKLNNSKLYSTLIVPRVI